MFPPRLLFLYLLRNIRIVQPEALLRHRAASGQGSRVHAVLSMRTNVSYTTFRCLRQVIAIPPAGVFPDMNALPQSIDRTLPHMMHLFQILCRDIPEFHPLEVALAVPRLLEDDEQEFGRCKKVIERRLFPCFCSACLRSNGKC